MLPVATLAILAILLAIRTGRRPRCPNCGRRMRKNGRYWRKKDKRWVQRYYCPNCGKTIISPRLEKPENPKCRKCGRTMRSHGSYRRKSDGATVKRYYCPNYRITLQAPIRSKKKRRASKHPLIFLDKILGFLGLIKQCPYCGGRAIRYGRDRLKSSFIVQVYRCKRCGRKFRLTTFIRILLRRIYPRSPCCHHESVRCGHSKNRQRFKCKKCGRTFISKISLRTVRTMLKPSLDQARKYFLPSASFVLRLFGETRGVGRGILRAIELGLRWVRLHSSYSSLEATLVSSRAFSISLDDAPDDNTIQRWVNRMDISVLQELIDFTYSLAKRYVPKATGRTLDLLILGVDSTAVTIIAPWYPQNSKTVEFHVRADLDLQMVCEISFDGPPSPQT